MVHVYDILYGAQVPMGILESVDIEKLDLGESPLRIGGLKVRYRLPGFPCTLQSMCAHTSLAPVAGALLCTQRLCMLIRALTYRTDGGGSRWFRTGTLTIWLS